METTPRMIEVAVGSVANRGNVIPLHELHNYIKYKTELYRSMFIYDDTFTGNVKTYQGTYDIDEIILDIDIKDENTNMKKTIRQNTERTTANERKFEVAVVAMQKDIEFIKYAITNQKKQK